MRDMVLRILLLGSTTAVDRFLFSLTAVSHTVLAGIALAVITVIAVAESFSTRRNDIHHRSRANRLTKMFTISFVADIVLGIVMAIELVTLGRDVIFPAGGSGPTLQELVFAILIPKVANGVVILVLLFKRKIRLGFVDELALTKSVPQPTLR